MRRKRFLLSALLPISMIVGLVAGEEAPSSLLVQQALREAQVHLQRGEPGSAVRVLERQLSQINGNATYLDLLAVAYEQYLAELQRLGRSDLMPTYLERLAILQPARAAWLRQTWGIPEAPKSPARPIIRGRLDEEITPAIDPSTDWNQLGDEAFAQGRYQHARMCYWRAAESQQTPSKLRLQRWAYCSWWEISHLMQASESSSCDWAVLLEEGRAAQQRSPDWPFVHRLMSELQRRQADPGYRVHHRPEPLDSWYLAESAHFRIYHCNAQLAEAVLRCAEHVHALNAWFWFGELTVPSWERPCEIYLHPDGTSFSRATGVSPSVPGFSTLVYDTADARRVLRRRMDIRADVPDLLTRLVPHETTHVSLAGRFGPRPLPYWADEALALLAEPDDRRQFFREKVLSAPREHLIPLEKLLTIDSVSPDLDRHMFYGQSLLLAEWLLAQRGKFTFVRLLQDASRYGFQPALQRYYGLSSLHDLAIAFRSSNNNHSVSFPKLPIAHYRDFHPQQLPLSSHWNR
ncbi:MAG: hypothetical protein RMI91_14370 [Gemmatales bacterium]|nr:hypothetical protein [Gemmatales bacterium]MDW7995831.1 hypothetical protein [Gemmatales bacterium]